MKHYQDEDLWSLSPSFDDTQAVLGSGKRSLEATTTSSVTLLTPTTPYVLPDPTTDQQTIITRGYKVMQGMNADSYFANTSNCFARITNLTFWQVPQYLYNVQQVYTLANAVPTD